MLTFVAVIRIKEKEEETNTIINKLLESLYLREELLDKSLNMCTEVIKYANGYKEEIEKRNKDMKVLNNSLIIAKEKVAKTLGEQDKIIKHFVNEREEREIKKKI